MNFNFFQADATNPTHRFLFFFLFPFVAVAVVAGQALALR
jgi:nitrate reductase NapE component